ncbi:MAG: drug/metabolite transporter (DMT)-like permease [Saprospiraceae bacterium]|jgi:drug/metabolite transporter (DMT)-like permease
MKSINNSHSKFAGVDYLGLAYAIGAALLFSFKPILVKLIYQYDVPTMTVLAWRSLLAAPIYLVVGLVMLANNNQGLSLLLRQKSLLIPTMLIGVVGYYGAAFLDLYGLNFISAQLERLILFTYPTIVAVLAWVIYKRRLTSTAIAALLISYIGIAVLFINDWQSAGDHVVIGSIAVFLAAVAFSLYVVLGKPFIDKVGGKPFTVLAMLSSGVVVLLHFLLQHSIEHLIIPMPAWWLILLMSVFSTVLPSFMLAAAIGRIGPDQTAITGTLGPVATSVLAVFLLNEAFGVPHVISLVCVLLSVFIMQRKRNRLPI